MPGSTNLQQMNSEAQRLFRGEAHVWMVRPQRCTGRELDLARTLLGESELARFERFGHPRSRLEFLVAHALCRMVLSRYADVRPGDWGFALTRRGRPEIAGPARAPPLRFNLSHADGLVACAVAWDTEVGVDVENITRSIDPLPLASRFFFPPEAESLRSLEPAAQRERFFGYWTLKEAYLKARGEGLSLPLDQFSFSLETNDVRLTVDPRLNDRGEDWQLARLRPTQDHVLALAVRKRPGAKTTTLFWETSLQQLEPISVGRTELGWRDASSARRDDRACWV